MFRGIFGHANMRTTGAAELPALRSDSAARADIAQRVHI